MTFWEVLRLEARAVFTNPAILLTVFGGVLFYSFLYPLPYASQVPREQRVVVANLDGSQLSRTLERMVDATPQVHIERRAHSLEEARELFVSEKMAGLLVIPEHFYRDLLLGRSPTLSYGGDASYFLVFGTVLEGMAAAGTTLAAQAKVQRMAMEGQPLSHAARQYSAIRLSLKSVFNPTGGYVNYVIPAVFILILHQTLLMGAGILGGTQNELCREGETGYWLKASPGQLLAARACVFTGIYWLLTMYYFGFSSSFYAIPRLADFGELNLVILPFLFAGSFLGICLGLVLPRRELATLVVLLSSMPLIFGSGFIWPQETIPAPLNAIIQGIPVVPAIKMFLALNQMGGDFASLVPLWLQMWGCAVLYGTTAWLVLRYRQAGSRAGTPASLEKSEG